jgi:prolipoprotein diacylglyceryltransferase
MAGAALGWIGCYLAGVAYGREVFPGDRWWFLAADLPDMYNLHNPRFAPQMLGAAWATVCFGISNIEYRMSNARFVTSGIRFAATMTIYSAGGFVLGFTRGDAAPMLGAWRLDQVIDAGTVAVGSVYILWSLVSQRNRIRAHSTLP